MGSGKTTVGKILANKMNVKFFDVDTIIERENKIKIHQIFLKYTENYFRKLELKTIKKIITNLRNKKAVVALGGGSLENNKNLNLVKNNGTLFYLKTTFKEIIIRVKKQRKIRPLFQELTLKQLKELLKKRELRYKQAHFILNTNKKTPYMVAKEICEK